MLLCVRVLVGVVRVFVCVGLSVSWWQCTVPVGAASQIISAGEFTWEQRFVGQLL